MQEQTWILKVSRFVLALRERLIGGRRGIASPRPAAVPLSLFTYSSYLTKPQRHRCRSCGKERPPPLKPRSNCGLIPPESAFIVSTPIPAKRAPPLSARAGSKKEGKQCLHRETKGPMLSYGLKKAPLSIRCWLPFASADAIKTPRTAYDKLPPSITQLLHCMYCYVGAG